MPFIFKARVNCKTALAIFEPALRTGMSSYPKSPVVWRSVGEHLKNSYDRLRLSNDSSRRVENRRPSKQAFRMCSTT